jgi:hypothetical protein
VRARLLFGACRKEKARAINSITASEASLFNRTAKYLTSYSNKQYRVMQMPLAGLSSRPVFDEGDHLTYAHHLASFMNVDVSRVTSVDQSLVSTWLYDKNGNRVYIPIDAK